MSLTVCVYTVFVFMCVCVCVREWMCVCAGVCADMCADVLDFLICLFYLDDFEGF